MFGLMSDPYVPPPAWRREKALDEAVRRVESDYPRTMKLLLEGHSHGEPLGGAGCIACADNVAAIRATFRRIMDAAA